ncbi:hypothetical protein F5884DRAFT_754948 [Xylogone sp. PMI_703]|nr:hypothetical protein F5884DRAFT_754948 [Xylogone sp. PMI_703]
MASDECSSGTQDAMPYNTITWTEIPVTDMGRATNFYRTVFGWDYSPFGGASVEDAPFVVFNSTGKPGQQNGGFAKVALENLLSPALHLENASQERMCVRVTISVASIDEKLKEIEKAGGSLYSAKGEIPGGDMGFVAKFIDTEKNVMGLWSMN